MKRISILGLGYIGLPTAIVAAQSGYEVLGFDIDQEKIKHINGGNPVIFEPELANRLTDVLIHGTFKAHTDLQYADCFIIAVPTPFTEQKKANTLFVFSAIEAIAKRLMPGNLVIIESTVPVGTTEQCAAILEEISGLRCGIDFFVAHCPERVLPGRIFKELEENDRIIGGMCQKACELARLFYSRFVKGVLHITDDKTAEMVKLIENSSRDVQIAFANQVASMCEVCGIDPYHVIALANKHPRVKILTPSCGVGGHCIAVDPYFLIETFTNETELLQITRRINESKPYQVISKILGHAERFATLHGHKPTILTLGLTFKPNVDDIRESPALKITKALNHKLEFLNLISYDPFIPQPIFENLGLTHHNNLKECFEAADIVVILVKHRAFEMLAKDFFEEKIVLDFCGLMYDMHAHQDKIHHEKTKSVFRTKSNHMTA